MALITIIREQLEVAAAEHYDVEYSDWHRVDPHRKDQLLEQWRWHLRLFTLRSEMTGDIFPNNERSSLDIGARVLCYFNNRRNSRIGYVAEIRSNSVLIDFNNGFIGTYPHEDVMREV